MVRSMAVQPSITLSAGVLEKAATRERSYMISTFFPQSSSKLSLSSSSTILISALFKRMGGLFPPTSSSLLLAQLLLRETLLYVRTTEKSTVTELLIRYGLTLHGSAGGKVAAVWTQYTSNLRVHDPEPLAIDKLLIDHGIDINDP